VLGNGKKIRFWLDVWVGECPFKIRFNNLFEISREQKWEVRKVFFWGGGGGGGGGKGGGKDS
jgi:hypothetical protein